MHSPLLLLLCSAGFCSAGRLYNGRPAMVCSEDTDCRYIISLMTRSLEIRDASRISRDLYLYKLEYKLDS
ncbi:uncharacterized protein RAG0_05294 [Rhynchosporium agropyri]|uniref:Uncharacterized protein n=1 Tax=Rhynchosporium agropyri TaxID=914238 RepID=A0A1E1KCM5_9HELO|nr:uncharacterized protein RAG0_05294 [Rhynchosporium agropyri]